MAYTGINKSSDFFNTKLYTGNGSYGHGITGVGFQPDLVWIKNRADNADHRIFDAVRGTDKSLSSNTTNATVTGVNLLHSFDSDGFTVDDDGAINTNNNAICSWNWKANGAGSANTAGSINSTVSVNTTSGFSIVKYTGNATVSTIGHGLGVAPKMIITKNLSRSEAWPVDCRQGNDGAGGIMYLNETGTLGAYGNTSPYPSTAPTSTVYSVGTAGNTNYSGSELIAYCFAEKIGFSKMGQFKGLGGTNYPFIYTGFKPAFVMVKRGDTGTSNWIIYDNKRQYNQIEGQYNPQRPRLAPNTTATESPFTSDNGVDFLSNGFVARDNSSGDAYSINVSGSKYIYMCFAEAPLVGTNNVPCTAR